MSLDSADESKPNEDGREVKRTDDHGGDDREPNLVPWKVKLVLAIIGGLVSLIQLIQALLPLIAG